MRHIHLIIKALIITILALFFISIVIFKLPKHLKHYEVSVIGMMNHADGIGRQAIDAAILLDKHFKVNGIAMGGNSKYLDDNALDIFNRGSQLGKVVLFEGYLASSVNDKKNKFEKIVDNQIITSFKREDQIFIAYSMFEYTSIPEIWVERLNKQFDMVAVPDPFLINTYRNSGVTIPIFFVPLGINLEKQLLLPLKNKRNDKFVFTNLSGGCERKNQLKLIEAFDKVQKIRRNVYLIINSRYAYPKVKENIESYIKTNQIANVQYSVGTLSPELYMKTTLETDCFIYPSKGEGFSIQPREAMAMGVPTIITDNTAQTTICNSGLIECVESKIETDGYCDWYNVYIGKYFDCNVNDLTAAMLKVYDNYDHYLAKSTEARKWAAQYTYDNLKYRYMNMVKPKILILGDKNEITDDYLMTNSKQLYEKYKALLAN